MGRERFSLQAPLKYDIDINIDRYTYRYINII